jgi:hypothetical protein
VVNKVHLISNRFQVLTCDGDKPLRSLCEGGLGEPEIPLVLPDVVASIRVNGLVLVIEGAALSNRITVHDHLCL